ncbi:MAG: hypothetical protein IIW40_02225 [Clostridia bacterium]|nr:hypothetical protein [Clostridia bacterium]
MKKLSILLCLIMTLSLLLASCGKPANDPTSSSAPLADSSDSVSEEDSAVSTDDTTAGTSAAETTPSPSVTTTKTPDIGQPPTTTTTAASTTKKTDVVTTWPSVSQKEETALEKLIKPYISTNPKVTEVPAYNPTKSGWTHIKAITFDGAQMNGKKTKVFAYIGFPKGASASKKVPAVVLVHGGGGHAFAEWVRIWNERGYAAIAMDTTGYFPSAKGKGIAGDNGDAKDLWQYGMYGPFSESGYVNAPNTDRMKNVPKQSNMEEHWMYHAVVSTILAHNILMTDNRVNVAKIGINGISWGGVITSLAIGYDTRYAYAVPIYGCGYLDEMPTYFGDLFSPAAVKSQYSAADRFGKVKIPTLWLAWVFDTNFSIDKNTKSYLDVKNAGGIMSIKQTWSHSHKAGWQAEETFRFADSICKGGTGLVSCVTEPKGRNVSFTVKKPADVTELTAKAYYITEKLSYSVQSGSSNPVPDQKAKDWKTVNCTVSGTKVTCTLPADAVDYYVELTAKTADGSYITTTGLVDARA